MYLRVAPPPPWARPRPPSELAVVRGDPGLGRAARRLKCGAARPRSVPLLGRVWGRTSRRVRSRARRAAAAGVLEGSLAESCLRVPLLVAGFIRVEDPSVCLLYTSPSPRDRTRSRMPSSA